MISSNTSGYKYHHAFNFEKIIDVPTVDKTILENIPVVPAGVGMTQENAKKIVHASLMNSSIDPQLFRLADLNEDSQESSLTILDRDELIGHRGNCSNDQGVEASSPIMEQNPLSSDSEISVLTGIHAVTTDSLTINSVNALVESACRSNPMDMLATAAMMVQPAGLPSSIISDITISANFSAISSPTLSPFEHHSQSPFLQLKQQVDGDRCVVSVVDEDEIEHRSACQRGTSIAEPAVVVIQDELIQASGQHSGAPIIPTASIIETDEGLNNFQARENLSKRVPIPLILIDDTETGNKTQVQTTQLSLLSHFHFYHHQNLCNKALFRSCKRNHFMLMMDDVAMELPAHIIDSYDPGLDIDGLLGQLSTGKSNENMHIVVDDATLSTDENEMELDVHELQDAHLEIPAELSQAIETEAGLQLQQTCFYVSDDEEATVEKTTDSNIISSPQLQIQHVDEGLLPSNQNPLPLPVHIIEVDHNVEGSHKGKDNNIEESESYQRLWQQRKTHLEKKAEERAKVKFYQWQRDERTLEDIIDGSLKEYIDLYESAHALRLQFEAEKSKWTSKIMQLLASTNRSTHPFSDPEQFQYFLDDSGDEEGKFSDSDDQKEKNHKFPTVKKRKFEDTSDTGDRIVNNFDSNANSSSSVFAVKKKFCLPLAIKSNKA